MKEVNNYVSIYRKALDKILYDLFSSPKELLIFSNLLKDFREGKIDREVISVFHQNMYDYFSIGEAYCLFKIFSSIQTGDIYIAKISLDQSAPDNPSLNEISERKKIIDSINCKDFSIDLSGTPQGADGYLKLTSPITVRNIENDTKLMDNLILPLEIGYQKIEKSISQINESGLVRWPYNNKNLWIITR